MPERGCTSPSVDEPQLRVEGDVPYAFQFAEVDLEHKNDASLVHLNNGARLPSASADTGAHPYIKLSRASGLFRSVAPVMIKPVLFDLLKGITDRADPLAVKVARVLHHVDPIFVKMLLSHPVLDMRQLDAAPGPVALQALHLN